MEKYEILETIGKGSFGNVHKALEKETREYVAIKKMKKKYTNWDSCTNLREVKSLTNLKHENIIRIKEMVREDDELNLIFEYMEQNLLDYIEIKKKTKFTEEEIKNIISQILQGTAYMHKFGYFHRDFKPENILVNSNGKIKIADFGLAREIRSIPPYTDYVSTRWYRAPECLLHSTNYNSPIDIWAIGAIMAEMYNFKPLFPGSNEKDTLFKICTVIGAPSQNTWPKGMIMAKKMNIKFPNFSSNSLRQMIPEASDEAIDIMSQMLCWDHSQRNTAQGLLSHSFFSSKLNINFPSKPIKLQKNMMNSSLTKFGENIFKNKIEESLNHNKNLSSYVDSNGSSYTITALNIPLPQSNLSTINSSVNKFSTMKNGYQSNLNIKNKVKFEDELKKNNDKFFENIMNIGNEFDELIYENVADKHSDNALERYNEKYMEQFEEKTKINLDKVKNKNLNIPKIPSMKNIVDKKDKNETIYNEYNSINTTIIPEYESRRRNLNKVFIIN